MLACITSMFLGIFYAIFNLIKNYLFHYCVDFPAVWTLRKLLRWPVSNSWWALEAPLAPPPPWWRECKGRKCAIVNVIVIRLAGWAKKQSVGATRRKARGSGAAFHSFVKIKNKSGVSRLLGRVVIERTSDPCTPCACALYEPPAALVPVSAVRRGS